MKVSFPQQFKNFIGESSHKLAKWSKDHHLLYHVSIATFAALHLVFKNAPLTFTKLIFTLNSVNAQVVYSLFKQPHDWFYPVTAHKIQEEEFMNRVSHAVNNAFKLNQPDHQLLAFGRKVAAKQLELMKTTDDAYQNEKELCQALEKLAINLSAKENEGKGVTSSLQTNVYYDFFQVRNQLFKDLKVPFRRQTYLGEKLTTIVFAIVDLQATLFTFKYWNVVDTAKWAAKIGQFKGFGWVQNRDLEYVLRATLCVGFALKLYEATRQLVDPLMNREILREKEERTKVIWDIVTAGADLVSNGIGFLNHAHVLRFSPTIIYGSLFAARMISVIRVITDH